MPLYHLDIKMEIGGKVVQVQQVVDCDDSEPGPASVVIARLVQKGETTVSEGSRRFYIGKLYRTRDLESSPGPEPVTDRRGAIRDQKAKQKLKGNDDE